MELITIFVLVVATTVTAREYTDEELSSFPNLFHLDDYDRCLAKRDGLYCLGIFDLTPDVQPNPTYELLKAYSDESYRHFNRTRIHRGYCVSSRCPQEATQNATQRFEHCVDKWARACKLRASINTLHYCQTHADKYAEQPMTRSQEIFLQCAFAIVVINIIGTIYDVYAGDNPNKNKLLVAFSIPANWRRLTVVHEERDSRLGALTPLNGIRVVAMLCTTYAHANAFHCSFHTINPDELEKHSQRLDGIILSSGTSVIQVFVMISCFFTCYNLLIYSQKHALNLFLLPLCIIKRTIRITPVNIFIVGFAATWWIHTRSGPLVSSTIGLESRACQSKFWSQVLYVNNIVDPANYCVGPTWFLAVDMHMYIVACTFTLLLWRRRTSAIKIYLVLFVTSCALIGIVSYIKQYKSFINFTTPETVRRIFRDTPSFTEFYISSWGSLPSCFLGLLMAHLQFELDHKSIKLGDYKWFVNLIYFIHPLLYTWALTGKLARQYDSPIAYAIYITFDRPVFCILACITILGMVNIDSKYAELIETATNIGPLRRFYGWKGWTKMSRVALTVMLLHWCVNLTIATRPVAYSTSVLDIIVDWIGTYVITYTLAIPITVLLEIPMQKFLETLLF